MLLYVGSLIRRKDVSLARIVVIDMFLRGRIMVQEEVEGAQVGVVRLVLRIIRVLVIRVVLAYLLGLGMCLLMTMMALLRYRAQHY